MRAIPVLLAVLCFTLLGLYQLYPAWLALDHAVVGEWAHPDLISNHWLYLWIVDQLSSGHGILHNDRYYFPVGDAPWLAGNGSDALPFLPLGLLLPWPASVTVWSLVTIVLNGLAGLWLARKVGALWSGAIIGGAAVAFSPYVAHELAGGHFAQAPLYWMGFFLVAWLTLLESAPTSGSYWKVGRRTTALAVGAGALFGVTSFIYWYYGLWAAWLGGLAFWAKPRWRVAPKFLVAAVVTTVPPLRVTLCRNSLSISRP